MPFLTINIPECKRDLKFLIDTGANKNIISPGIIDDAKSTKRTFIKNVSGNKEVNKKGKLDIFKGFIKPLTFYELKFHTFFDGIIGSQFFAKYRAKIDYQKEMIRIPGKKNIKFDKYYPVEQKQFSHTVTLEANTNGDWFVPTFQKLCKNTYIMPGLYNATNHKTTVNIISSSKTIPSYPKLGLNVNNFEAFSPLPINKDNLISKDEITNLIRLDHLSLLERSSLIDLIYNKQQVLLRRGEKLSSTTAIKHKILTSDDIPVYTKSYRYPHHFIKDVEEQVQEMLDNGIITHSVSPYSSPIWVVPKKTDASGKRKVRVVIDYRKLNEKTVNDKYPIPQIEDILDHLGKSVYFSTLDLKSGFHQIEMDPKHKEKTAFSTNKGHFEFTRMPFGLKNAPATFQRAMNNILGDYIGKICYVYLDDIVIVGRNLNEHLKNLALVLKRLSEFNLKIQLDKCEFLKKETEFLGHIIAEDGVKPNPEKIDKIMNWPIPKNDKEIKQFLGLAGYYRRFIKDFSKITRNMTKYLKKDVVLNIKDPDYINAFNTLKKVLSTDQVLSYPEFDKPFILTTDASDFALGAVLSQIQEGVEKPIAFGSRTLTDTESRYATNEKEALAIKWAVTKYKPYLFGGKFTLITDHKPLTFIKTSEKNSKILRWRLELENYDYDVKYKEGKTNVVADALSRRPVETNNNEISAITGVPQTNQLGEVNIGEEESDTDTMHSANDSDDYYIHFTDRPINQYRNQLIFKISNITTVITETLFTNFNRTIVTQPTYDKIDMKHFLKTFHNGKQTALLAPESLINTIQEVFKENFGKKGHFVFTSKMVDDVQNEDRQNLIITKEHDRAHRGISEVEAQLKRSYFFPNMSKLIRNHINSCKICNRHKYERKPYNIKISPRPITDKPFQRVHMDIFIIAKHCFLSLVDSFSKHLQMYFIKTRNLTDVQKAIGKYISTFGVPTKIITDHETTFRSIQFKNYLETLGSTLEYASSSESNGQVERAHSTIIEIYNTNKHKFKGSGVKTLIKISVALYNNSIHSATTFTPNEIVFNHNNIENPEEILENAQRIFLEAKQNMSKSQKKLTKHNDNMEDPPGLEEGQEVFVIPQIRKKTDERANITKAFDIKHKTFKNSTNTKRNKNKIKRLKHTNH